MNRKPLGSSKLSAACSRACYYRRFFGIAHVATSWLLILLSSKTSATFFDSAGRLPQVERANKASMRGGTVIAAHSCNCSIVLTWSRRADTAMELPPKIHRLAEYLGLSSAGVVSDANFLHDRIFDEVIESSFLFGEPSPAIRIANSAAEFIHSRTLSAMHRPLGVRLCFIAYDEVSKAQVLEVDSMGNVHRCQISCIGPIAETFIENWDQTKNLSDLPLASLFDSIIDNLRSCLVDKEQHVLQANELGVAVVGKGLPFTVLSRESIEKLISRHRRTEKVVNQDNTLDITSSTL